MSLAPTVFGPAIIPVLYWLVGLAVVWLLWRRASGALAAPLARRQRRSALRGPPAARRATSAGTQINMAHH